MIERKPIVVNYRPSHLYWLLALIAAFVLAILFLGKLWGTMVSDWELAEKAELEVRTAELEAQLVDRTTELSRIKLSSEVDAAALENSRQEMIGLQRQIYQRDQELKLYRELLQDNDQPNGLSVSDLNLEAMDDGRIQVSLGGQAEDREDADSERLCRCLGYRDAGGKGVKSATK